MERFDISSLKLPTESGGCSFVLIGATRSGKSTAMSYIYDKFFEKHITILFTYSAHTQVYENLKGAAIADRFCPELLTEPMTINRNTNNKYNFCVIFDDFALTAKNAEAMTRLLTTGRNSGMSVLITGQRMEMLNRTGRANCNYILCFRQNTDSDIENTIKTYLNSYFPKGLTMEQKIEIYRQVTQDHSFFFVDTLEGRCCIGKIPL
jgi:adenylate kinase family enzyme